MRRAKPHQKETSEIPDVEEAKIAPVALLYRSSGNMNASKKQHTALHTLEGYLRGEKPFLVQFRTLTLPAAYGRWKNANTSSYSIVSLVDLVFQNVFRTSVFRGSLILLAIASSREILRVVTRLLPRALQFVQRL